jgi:hypothetical protein
MKFYSIEIKFNQELITLVPINCFKITDDSNKIIVIYELKYFLNSEEKHVAHINYYLSDGNTNQLRANMLFPFLCYHQQNSESCIKIFGRYSYNFNLIVKVGGIQNIKMDNINEKILNKTKVQIHEENKKTLGESDKMMRDYLKIFFTNMFFKLTSSIDNSKFNFTVDASSGLISVLPRIENLLDLIIAIYSDQLINLQDIDYYEPIPRINCEQFDVNYYDFKHSVTSLSLKPNSTYSPDDIMVEKILRQNLVNELHNMFVLLTKSKLFTARVVIFEPTDISKKSFNDRYAEICKDKKINDSKKLNFAKYFIISHYLLKIVKSKINNIITSYNQEICKINKQSSSIDSIVNFKSYTDKINELTNLMSMFSEKTLYKGQNLETKEDTYLEKNIGSWAGSC